MVRAGERACHASVIAQVSRWLLIGVVVYLIVRGDAMHERSVW